MDSLNNNGKRKKYKKTDGKWALKKRIKLAENPATSIEILEMLSNDSDAYYVRKAVAANIHTPIEVLRKLSDDTEYYIRARVAINPNTPIDILKKLSKDGWREVRLEVASNKNTTAEILKTMYKDHIWEIRRALLDNPNTPKEYTFAIAYEDFKPGPGSYDDDNDD